MRMLRTFLRCLLTVVALGVLCACGSVPLRTMWKLHSFGAEEFVALNPAALRVAVGLEKGRTAGGARLKMSMQPAGSDDIQRFNFGLIPAAADAQLATPSGRPSFWKLATADVPEFRRMQGLIATAHEEKRKSQFTLSAQANHINYPDDVVPPTMRLSIYLRLAADQEYLTLIKDALITTPTPADDESA